MATCPRCQTALEEQQLDAFVFRLCRGCQGILGRHDDVMQVVDGSWRAVPEPKADDTPLHVKPESRQETGFACPDCRRPMEKYGYMGMQAITIDRCDRCALLWLDADELQNMVLALARDQYRLERAVRAERAGILDLTRGALPPVGGKTAVWLFDQQAEQVSAGWPNLALNLLLLLARR